MHTNTPLLLLLGTLLTPALTHAFASAQTQELISVWTSLDHDSPEYRKCLETDCAEYLNIHAVCDALKNDGNYTSDPKVEKENYLRCVCVEEDGFLPSLEKCDKCTGESKYPKMKTECDKRTGSNTAPPTNTKTSLPDTSTSTVTTGSPTSTVTTGSPTSTETGSQPSTTSDAPEETPTDTNNQDGSAGVRSLQLGSWMGVGYSLVMGGVVAFWAVM